MIHTKASVSGLMSAYENSITADAQRELIDPANIVAKLTVTFNDRTTWVIEIHTDATYHDFYHLYHLTFGADAKLAKIPFTLPAKNRNYNTRWAQNFEPGLSFVLTEIKRTRPGEVLRGDISIYNKQLYQHLITCGPDELGKGLTIDVVPNKSRFAYISSQTDAERQEINIRGERSESYRRLMERRARRMGWKQE